MTAQADHLKQLRDLTSVDALRHVDVGSGVLQQVLHVQAVVHSPLLSLDDEDINEKAEKLRVSVNECNNKDNNMEILAAFRMFPKGRQLIADAKAKSTQILFSLRAADTATGLFEDLRAAWMTLIECPLNAWKEEAEPCAGFLRALVKVDDFIAGAHTELYGTFCTRGGEDLFRDVLSYMEGRCTELLRLLLLVGGEEGAKAWRERDEISVLRTFMNTLRSKRGVAQFLKVGQHHLDIEKATALQCVMFGDYVKAAELTEDLEQSELYNLIHNFNMAAANAYAPDEIKETVQAFLQSYVHNADTGKKIMTQLERDLAEVCAVVEKWVVAFPTQVINEMAIHQVGGRGKGEGRLQQVRVRPCFPSPSHSHSHSLSPCCNPSHPPPSILLPPYLLTSLLSTRLASPPLPATCPP